MAVHTPPLPPFASPRVMAPALLALVVVQSGCTSALSTALMRDMPWDVAEHAAETAPPEEADDAAASTAESEPAPTAAESAAARDSARAAAVEQAMQRLAGVATLDAATEAALVDILRDAPQEDWPVVVEEFTASLAATATTAAAPQATSPPPPEPAAVEAAAIAPPAAVEPVPVAAAPPEPTPAAAEPAPPVVAAEPSLPEPPPPAELAVRNACFVSRVRGWGDVDRFADARFRPGQEVIVYFELDNLATTESAAGHTTRIDTALRLVDAGGGVVHAWSFEPVTETCAGRRRDYFARYVVRMPEALGPGACRVELAVTDAAARVTATASLPCEIAAD